MLKRLRSVLAVVVTANVALLALGSPAQAADTAYNTKIQWLTANPDGSMATSCRTISIKLDRGRYGWGNVRGADNFWIRDIDLASGTYTWRTCLDPRDGGLYYFTSTLEATSAPANIHLWTSIPADGHWRWGSYLDPYF